jgi:hypothetical protein
VSLAAFAASWVLAARNGDLFDLSAEFAPDRFMIAYAVAGTVLASRQRSNPVGWFLLGMVQHVLAPEHVSLWLCDQPEAEERAGADTYPVRY